MARAALGLRVRLQPYPVHLETWFWHSPFLPTAVMPHFKMLPKALDASLRKCYRSYVRTPVCFRFAWASLRLSHMTALLTLSWSSTGLYGHYLAGLGHIPKLPCKLQDSDFRLDDLLLVCHSLLLVSKVYQFFRQVSDFILSITYQTIGDRTSC